MTALDMSSVQGSQCTPDLTIYNATRSFASTDFYFVEECNDCQKEEQGSAADTAADTPPYRDTRDVLKGLMDKEGYRQHIREGAWAQVQLIK